MLFEVVEGVEAVAYFFSVETDSRGTSCSLLLDKEKRPHSSIDHITFLQMLN